MYAGEALLGEAAAEEDAQAQKEKKEETCWKEGRCCRKTHRQNSHEPISRVRYPP